jgi:REP element-mobilizing transposase RayT
MDRHHNVPGTPLAGSSPRRVAMKGELMNQPAYLLDERRRMVVLEAIREVCSHRGWYLLAAHVRTNHVHAVVEADVGPEIVMNAFKAYASRAMNPIGIDPPNRKRWARHGSTRWLYKDGDVQEAIRYVVFGQGDSMEVYLAELL